MSAAVATKEAQSTELAVFNRPRLPFHPAFEDRFGVDRGMWKVLVESIFPAAESADAVALALSYCKARNLDVFKRPVQIVPIYDKRQKRMVETVWPGISELRTTAMRTREFAGIAETVFGPDVSDNLSGTEITYPEWAQCIVYRMVGANRVPFYGPKVYWRETYATASRDTAAPNAMWKKRPRGQLEKCAEAAALRRAFPEEIGNEIAAEEMEGQTFGTIRDVTPQKAGLADRLAQRAASEPASGFSTANIEDAIAEAVSESDAPATDPEATDEGYDFDAFLAGEAEAAEKHQTAAPLATQDVEVRKTLTAMNAGEDVLRRWATIHTEAQVRIAKATKRKRP